jgi:hypothetical protein
MRGRGVSGNPGLGAGRGLARGGLAWMALVLLAGCNSRSSTDAVVALTERLAQSACAETRAPDSGRTASERASPDVQLASLLRELSEATPERFLALPYVDDASGAAAQRQRVCSQPVEGMAECVMVECRDAGGRSACVEYVVSARVFDADAAGPQAPPEEEEHEDDTGTPLLQDAARAQFVSLSPRRPLRARLAQP